MKFSRVKHESSGYLSLNSQHIGETFLSANIAPLAFKVVVVVVASPTKFRKSSNFIVVVCQKKILLWELPLLTVNFITFVNLVKFLNVNFITAHLSS